MTATTINEIIEFNLSELKSVRKYTKNVVFGYIRRFDKLLHTIIADIIIIISTLNLMR